MTNTTDHDTCQTPECSHRAGSHLGSVGVCELLYCRCTRYTPPPTPPIPEDTVSDRNNPDTHTSDRNPTIYARCDIPDTIARRLTIDPDGMTWHGPDGITVTLPADGSHPVQRRDGSHHGQVQRFATDAVVSEETSEAMQVAQAIPWDLTSQRLDDVMRARLRGGWSADGTTRRRDPEPKRIHLSGPCVGSARVTLELHPGGGVTWVADQ